ncbi:phage tail tape measure protein, partial [Rahnella victoriana]
TTLGKIAGGALLIIGALGVFGLVAGPVISGINLIVAAASMLWTILGTVGSAIITVIGGLTWPVVAVAAAIVAGALIIHKYWEPISAFFAGVIEGLGIAFAPVKELFSPLKPVFDWLGDKLKMLWQWFKDLIEPVKSTQETLNNCKDTGVMFGRAIANALTAPLQAFNKLRSGVDWLLEKLGIIKDESADLDKNASKARNAAAAGQDPLTLPPGNALGGAYVPVSAGGGSSYVDRSTHTYQISAGNALGGADASKQIRAELEARDRARAAQQRSRMDND